MKPFLSLNFDKHIKRQLFAKFKHSAARVQSHHIFSTIAGGSEPYQHKFFGTLQVVVSYYAYHNFIIIEKSFTN